MGATIRIAILANAAKAKAELDSVGAAASKYKDQFKAIGAAVGVAATGFAINAVKQASDLNETMSKSSVIFGQNAQAMERWASGAAQSTGLSKAAALDAAASFGDMFTQIGMNSTQAADLSKSTLQLAADLGSFNNLDTADVMDRISAAYRGEYDSLQAVIPNISAARVEQEALALAHKTSAKELTAQDKALAVNAILTKDGARAVGDFARTSEGAANQQKILRAEFDNLSAAVGQKLLPVLNIGLQILGQVMNVLSNPAVATLAVALGALAAAVYVVNVAAKAYAATQAALNIVMMANPVGLVVVAIAALVAMLVIAYKRSETFRNAVNAVWNTMKSVWSGIPGFVSGILNKIYGFFNGMKSKITGFFSSAGSWLKDAASRVIQGFVDGLNGAFGRVRDTLSRLTNMLPSWKGPRSTDERILRRSGQYVIEGFQDGLEDRYGNVQRSLSGFTGGLSGSVDLNPNLRASFSNDSGAANGSTGQTIEVSLTSGYGISSLEEVIWDLLKKRIRVSGGNVQNALGVNR